MNAFFETTNGFNFQIIDPLIESRGVRLTWFDCKMNNINTDKIIHVKHAVVAVLGLSPLRRGVNRSTDRRIW